MGFFRNWIPCFLNKIVIGNQSPWLLHGESIFDPIASKLQPPFIQPPSPKRQTLFIFKLKKYYADKKRTVSLILTEILICRLDRGIFLCLLWWLVISFLHLNSTSKSIADTNYWQVIWTDVNVLSSEIPHMSANMSTDSWMRIAQIVIHYWSTQSNVCESMRLFNRNCISLLCYFYWIVETNCRFYGISNL